MLALWDPRILNPNAPGGQPDLSPSLSSRGNPRQWAGHPQARVVADGGSLLGVAGWGAREVTCDVEAGRPHECVGGPCGAGRAGCGKGRVTPAGGLGVVSDSRPWLSESSAPCRHVGLLTTGLPGCCSVPGSLSRSPWPLPLSASPCPSFSAAGLHLRAPRRDGLGETPALQE